MPMCFQLICYLPRKQSSMNNSMCAHNYFFRVFFTILMALCVTHTYADMGYVSASDAKVSEEGQKAIILHNYIDEVLILGTDLKADKSTGILRFIPFPSEPTVKLASEKAFESIAALIQCHELKFVTQSKSGTSSYENVEMRFNQKMGAHDITVVKITSAIGFREWVNNFFKKKNLPLKEEYAAVEKVVADYVSRGITWFVIDYVDVTPETKFIEPIEYRFKSKELYYPLKDTNTFGGSGAIDLVIVAPFTLLNPLHTYYSGCFGLRNMHATTSSRISYNELSDILPDAESFFDSRKIFIQTLSYLGEYQFNNDIFADLTKGTPAAIWHEESGPYFQEELNGITVAQAISSLIPLQQQNNYFSMKMPRDWKVTETDLLKTENHYQLMLSTPGTKYMEYTSITVDWFADETKTPERYLFDLQNPDFRPLYEDYGLVKPLTVAGKPAWQLDMKSKRSPLLGTEDKAINVAKKYVVIPATVGYYVIHYDSPMDATRLYIDMFDEVVKSFVPTAALLQPAKSVKEISEEEYQLFAYFFSTSKSDKKLRFPEYFTHVLDAKVISSHTLVAKKGDNKELFKMLGEDAKTLTGDYLRKNSFEYLIKDRIMVSGISILSEQQRKKEIGLREVPSARFRELVYLSRVGFNLAKTRALFYVSVASAPATSYYVVMQKKGDKWEYEDALMAEMLIF